MLTIDTIPLYALRVASSLSYECFLYSTNSTNTTNPQLLILAMQAVAAAATAEFIQLKPVRRVLFILRRHVIPLFALGALQNDVISRHNLPRCGPRSKARGP